MINEHICMSIYIQIHVHVYVMRSCSLLLRVHVSDLCACSILSLSLSVCLSLCFLLFLIAVPLPRVCSVRVCVMASCNYLLFWYPLTSLNVIKHLLPFELCSTCSMYTIVCYSAHTHLLPLFYMYTICTL